MTSFQEGRLNDAEQQFKQVLRDQPKHLGALNVLSVLLAHLERYAEAERYIKIAVEINSSSAVTFYNYGLILNALKRPTEALERFNEALAIDATEAGTWNSCGVVLNDLELYDDAVAKFNRAIALRPNYPEAFSNKGKALVLLKREEEAFAAYEKALALKPDLAEAWFGRGNIVLRRRQYEDAGAAYRRALTYKPDLSQARTALAYLLLSEGNIAEALDLARRSFAGSETTQTKLLLASCLSSPLVQPGMGDLRDLLKRALMVPWGRPSGFAHACARFLMLNEAIRDSVGRAEKAWPSLLPTDELAGSSSLAAIAEDSLFGVLLETTPICNVALERFATMLRFTLLTLARTGKENAQAAPVLSLYCSLARQCFINSYVFAQSNMEVEDVRTLRETIVAALEYGTPIPALSLVAVAAYIPLHTLSGAKALLDRSWPDVVSAVVEQQVRAPLEEQLLRASIPALTVIEDDVSEQVREQYEESPYPQWVKTVLLDEPQTIDEFMRANFPLSSFVDLNRSGNVDVLIAGCGTGRHAIETAWRLKAAQVLAVDLSLTSLCYAHRQTCVLAVNNIQYAQADITKLRSIGRTFDVIESVGVLHHLSDPFAGWRVLLSLLRPGGIMRLGFYSEIARRSISEARALIAERGYRPTADDIRRCRQELLEYRDGTSFKEILRSPNFFSLNECRDLLFHVQEHLTSLPEIAGFIAETDLRFLGFDLDLQSGRNYMRRFPTDPNMTDLMHWHQYETDNPHTFSKMYQFWVQRNN
jgi:tetratricopeptide (TPR) repeat protein/SAM-dependent methyltransferase